MMPPGAPRGHYVANLWPGGIVPYEVSGLITGPMFTALQGAIREIENSCRVRFVPYTGQPNYIRVQTSTTGNNSWVGMQGGRQIVNIRNWHKYIIAHELLHALGMWHEQQRSDRNQFVFVNPNVIIPNQLHNFNIISGTTLATPYDFDSVMHYSQSAWSTCWPNPGCATITVLPPNQAWQTRIGQLAYLSTGDKDTLRAMYGWLPPSHDGCGTPLTAYNGVNIVDNRGATDGAPGCASQRDAWYTYRAACTGNVTIDFTNPSPANLDPEIAVWTSAQCPPLGAPIACAVTQPASITFPSVMGVTYLLRVGAAAEGTVRMNITCALAPCPQAGASWVLRSPTNVPQARWDHAMSYDELRGLTVMFGGAGGPGGTTLLGDTWTWNGSDWTLRFTPGPPARRGHAMAYDAARDRVVLFGGNNGGFLRDTWEWDGTSWTMVANNTGPSARWGHAMAYDAARNQVVLFGGWNGPYLNDTWAWNGTAWTQLSASGPPGRQAHGMAYDAARQRIVMFGGFDASGPMGDTAEWDGAAWNTVGASGPPARYAHAMSAASSGVAIFGGWTPAGFLGDTWTFNGSAWTQHTIGGPSNRWVTRMAYDSSRSRLVLFGGSTAAGYSAETWEGALGINNDDCATAAPVSEGAFAVDTRCAASGGAGACAGAQTSDVWYLYSPSHTGRATIALTASNFPGRLAV